MRGAERLIPTAIEASEDQLRLESLDGAVTAVRLVAEIVFCDSVGDLGDTLPGGERAVIWLVGLTGLSSCVPTANSIRAGFRELGVIAPTKAS